MGWRDREAGGSRKFRSEGEKGRKDSYFPIEKLSTDT